jgi:hypothetical protein
MDHFIFDWRFEQGEYHVWWVDDVSVSAHSPVHQQADMAVSKLLMDRFPFTIPEVSYLFCPPVYEKWERFQSDWLLLQPNPSVELVENGIGHYFSEGACEGCGIPLGERNEKDFICVARLEEPADAVRIFKDSGIVAFSESFLRSVFADSTEMPIQRPVQGIHSPDQQCYFELKHQSSARAVSVDSEEQNGRRCSWCGRVFIGSRGKQGQLKHFIDCGSINLLSCPMVQLENAFWNRTIMTENAFKRLMMNNARRGIFGARVGVVPAKDIVPDGIVERWKK